MDLLSRHRDLGLADHHRRLPGPEGQEPPDGRQGPPPGGGLEAPPDQQRGDDDGHTAQVGVTGADGAGTGVVLVRPAGGAPGRPGQEVPQPGAVGGDDGRGHQGVHGGGAVAERHGRPPQERGPAPEQHGGADDEGGRLPAPARPERPRPDERQGQRPGDRGPDEPGPAGVPGVGGGGGHGIGDDDRSLVAERPDETAQRPGPGLLRPEGDPGPGGGEVDAGVDDAVLGPEGLLDPGGAGAAGHPAAAEFDGLRPCHVLRRGGDRLGGKDGLGCGGHWFVSLGRRERRADLAADLSE